MQNKVSVIIPCYNVSKYLPLCFESLDNQLYRDFEIIFVDDGSTDNTLELLQKYVDRVDNAVVISQDNGGLGCARNTGLRNSSGDYVCFYDPDDILSPQYLSTLMMLVTIDNIDLGVCGFKKVIEKKYDYLELMQQNEKHNFGDEYVLYGDEIINKYFGWDESYLGIFVWNKIYRRDIIDKYEINFSTIRHGEDAFFNAQYLIHCQSVRVSKKTCVYYVQRRTSLSNEHFSEKRFDFYKPLLNFINTNGSDILKQGVYTYFAKITQYTLWKCIVDKYHNVKAVQKMLQIFEKSMYFFYYNSSVPKHIKLLFKFYLMFYKLYFSVNFNKYKNIQSYNLPKELDFDI